MAKDKIARFGVSLSKSLLKELDRMVQEKGYRNRSLAIGDMVRDHLVGHQLELGDSEVAGTITLVYDHHRSHVQDALTDLQHSRPLHRVQARVPHLCQGDQFRLRPTSMRRSLPSSLLVGKIA
jgi:metal-responsive CopG/Arc/MetJ family transcriptional regulator